MAYGYFDFKKDKVDFSKIDFEDIRHVTGVLYTLTAMGSFCSL